VGVAGREPNERLLAAIRESRLTYGAVARSVCRIAAENGDHAVRTNASAVAHWVAGTHPAPRTAAFLAEALSRKLRRTVTSADVGLSPPVEPAGAAFGSDPVAALAHLGRADVDRRTFLSSVVFSLGALTVPLGDGVPGRAALPSRGARRVGRAEVAAVREVTRVFTGADERLGGSCARSAVVEYLCTDVTAYCNGLFALDDDRRAMFGAAAELAYLAGWKAHDAGLAGLAQRYYLHAFELATESDPGPHAGYVLRILAHQAMDLGEREHCVDLACAALARAQGKVGADTESLFWLTVARAHAANSSARAATTALRRAERQLERSGGDEAPGWASLGGPAEARLASQAGKTMTALGRLRAAEDEFARSAACWDPVTHPRIHALTLAELAEVQCAQGNLEEACATWSRALDGMAGVASARTRGAVSSMRRRLSAFRGRDIPAARQLDLRATALYPAS
jgi:hypothetical protein